MKFKLSHSAVFALVAYILAVLFVDIIYFIAFCLGGLIPDEISLIITFAIYCVILFLGRKKVEFYDNKLTLFDILSIVAVMIIALPRVSCFDTSYDTANYHFSNQFPQFINYIRDDVGIGHFQIWSQKLGDRCFYLFQKTFGYRFGTIFNVIITIVIFIQLSKICHMLLKKYIKTGVIVDLLSAIISLASVVCQEVAMQWDCYYVDLLPIPLALELIFMIYIYEYSNWELYLFALICGLSITIKLTSVTFVGPLVLVYIIQNRKQIRFSSIIKCTVIGIFTDVVYLLFNWICTSNPVFPYCNSIFKSPYYYEKGFKDSRWGPQSFKEILEWPFHFVFNHNERISEIPMIDIYRYKISLVLIVSATLVVIVSSVICMIKKTARRRDEATTFVSGLFLWFWASSYLWAFTTGYGRYYLINEIMMPILAVVGLLMIVEKLNKEDTRTNERTTKYEEINSKIVVCWSLVILVGTYMACSSVYSGRTWTWQAANRNVTHSINDIEIDTSIIPTDKPVLLVCDQWCHSYASMVKKSRDNIELLSCSSNFLYEDSSEKQYIHTKIEYYENEGYIYFIHSSQEAGDLKGTKDNLLAPLGLEMEHKESTVLKNEAIEVYLTQLNYK